MRIDVLHERVRQAMLDARRQVGLHPCRWRRRACRTSTTVFDKLKEARRRKGRLDDEAAERSDRNACTKPSATFSSSARATPTASARWCVRVAARARRRCIAALIVLPASWRTRDRTPTSTPMMITLGGSRGPDAGGMTPIAGKAGRRRSRRTRAERERRPRRRRRRWWSRADAKPVPKTPPKPIEKPDDKSTSRKPTTGAGDQDRRRRASTPAARRFRSAGCRPAAVAAAGSGVHRLRELLLSRLPEPDGRPDQAQLEPEPGRGGQGADEVHDPPRRHADRHRRSRSRAASPLLDLESQRALTKTQRLPPLPREFTENHADGSPRFSSTSADDTSCDRYSSPPRVAACATLALSAQDPPQPPAAAAERDRA